LAQSCSRSIAHPGPVSPERFRAARGSIERRSVTLRSGCSANEAIGEAIAAAGFSGGYLRLKDAAMEPMGYVIPAASPDDKHAAWYSDIFAPAGVTRVEDAGFNIGSRDGKSFFHCHGIWMEPDGRRRMGHLLPDLACFQKPVEAEMIGIRGARFEATEDAETNFKLFMPERHGKVNPAGGRALLAQVRANADICHTIEETCRLHRIESAVIHGIGSLIGVEFTNGTVVDSYATEALITRGELFDRHGERECRLDIALVDMDGAIWEGTVKRGVNPVCVTFEVLIEEKRPRP
jgi:predicted DNA-binding protein with PD1-like motif